MGEKREGAGKKEGGEEIREERQANQGLDWCDHLVSSTGGLKLASPVTPKSSHQYEVTVTAGVPFRVRQVSRLHTCELAHAAAVGSGITDFPTASPPLMMTRPTAPPHLG